YFYERVGCLSEGNPLFLRIAAIEMNRFFENGKTEKQRIESEKEAIEQARRNLWDYLENRVYEQWNKEMQDFILEISVVDEFDEELAQQITGRSNVKQLIEEVKETTGFLQEKNQVYTCRKTVLICMRRQLGCRLTSEQIRQLYIRAGTCYEKRGDMAGALKMYETAQGKEQISSLLVENAKQNPGSGCYFELRRYYLSLPDEMICKSPLLITGMSMLQSMLMNIEESERWYQQLQLFAEKHKGTLRHEAKSRLIYLDIALPHRGIARMTDLLLQAGKLLCEKKVILPEFSVTSNLPSMMNGGKDFCEWSLHDKELAGSIGKVVELVLGRCGNGLVNLALAESLLEKGGEDFEITLLLQRGRMQAEAGGKTEQCFVAVGLLSKQRVMHNHLAEAVEQLDSFKKRAIQDAPQLLHNIETLRCRYFLYLGKTEEVKQWAGTAPEEEKEFCTLERYRYLMKARIYIQDEKYDCAVGLLEKLLYYADVMHRTYVEIEAGLLLSMALYRMNNAIWKEYFQKSFLKAKKYHFVWIISQEGIAVLPLLKRTIGTSQEEYEKTVLEQTVKMAQYYPLYLEKESFFDEELTAAELQILKLHGRGMSTREIQKLMSISESTLKFHNSNIYRKLDVKNKNEAVITAQKIGLLL
ncbi:MAG TPA: LuxR C-terminal-related transcriptional regulator, partial [Lachnospiraceae bacterium]|nr:LuxR C-terminal-related transcriptional regulator [Lachnospiraceae bacterium]